VEVALGARGQTLPKRPADDAPLTDWNAYWELRLAALSKQVGWVKDDLKASHEDMAEKLAAERGERHASIAQVQEKLRVVVGGDEGRGLAVTWWGLVLTAVGTALQAIG
jgi:hypothetical protein